MKNKLKIGDLVIIVTVLVATGLLFYVVYSNKGDGGVNKDGVVKGPVALIYNVDDPKNIAEIDLGSVKDGSYDYHDEKSKVNLTVEIKDKKIAMTSIDCPDQVCVSTGFIGNSMIPIICLPNKIIIEIPPETDPTQQELDKNS